MPTKMRLQRFGKKGRPFYHIVIADGRAPRDGRFIEKIGTYNPVSKPAEIDLDFEKAYTWLTKGADPTPTVKSILSEEGVLHYNHLMKGVDKGAFTKEIAEVRFNEWKETKAAKLSSAAKSEMLTDKEALKKRLEEEAKVNEARAAEIAKKRAREAQAANETEVADEAEVAEEAVVETVEEPAAEVVETVAAEEPVAEVAVEEPVAEVAAEEPVAETPAEATEEPAAEDSTEEKPAE